MTKYSFILIMPVRESLIFEEKYSRLGFKIFSCNINDVPYKFKEQVLFCTSLCKKLVKLTWVFSRSFSMPCASFSMLDGPGGTGCDVPVRGSSKFNKFLAKWSENNTYYSARSRWTKEQYLKEYFNLPMLSALFILEVNTFSFTRFTWHVLLHYIPYGHRDSRIAPLYPMQVLKGG